MNKWKRSRQCFLISGLCRAHRVSSIWQFTQRNRRQTFLTISHHWNLYLLSAVDCRNPWVMLNSYWSLHSSCYSPYLMQMSLSSFKILDWELKGVFKSVVHLTLVTLTGWPWVVGSACCSEPQIAQNKWVPRPNVLSSSDILSFFDFIITFFSVRCSKN